MRKARKFNPKFMPLCTDVTKYIRLSMLHNPKRRFSFLKARLRLRAQLPRYAPFTTGDEPK